MIRERKSECCKFFALAKLKKKCIIQHLFEHVWDTQLISSGLESFWNNSKILVFIPHASRDLGHALTLWHRLKVSRLWYSLFFGPDVFAFFWILILLPAPCRESQPGDRASMLISTCVKKVSMCTLDWNRYPYMQVSIELCHIWCQVWWCANLVKYVIPKANQNAISMIAYTHFRTCKTKADWFVTLVCDHLVISKTWYAPSHIQKGMNIAASKWCDLPHRLKLWSVLPGYTQNTASLRYSALRQKTLHSQEYSFPEVSRAASPWLNCASPFIPTMNLWRAESAFCKQMHFCGTRILARLCIM